MAREKVENGTTRGPRGNVAPPHGVGGKAGTTLIEPAQRLPSRGTPAAGRAGSRPQPPSSAHGGGGHGNGGHPGADSAVRRFGIDEVNLATRRDFIRLGEEERLLLEDLTPWARSVATQIAKEFYNWQFEFQPTLRFFEGYAQSAGRPISQVRQALERAQAGYFTQIFEGAEESWGVGYFERRLKVGAIHDRINLPFKWYIGSYAEFQRLTSSLSAGSLQRCGEGRSR